MMDKLAVVSVELRPLVEAEIKKRESGIPRDALINRDLFRYYFTLQQTLEENRPKLGINEASLIIDALSRSSKIMRAENFKAIWIVVEDAIKQNRLDEVWKVDGDALVEKLLNASFAEKAAIIDAAERFWNDNRGSLEACVKKAFCL